MENTNILSCRRSVALEPGDFNAGHGWAYSVKSIVKSYFSIARVDVCISNEMKPAHRIRSAGMPSHNL